MKKLLAALGFLAVGLLPAAAGYITLLGAGGGAGITPVFQTDLTSISTLPSQITFSRASNAMAWDSTGKLTYAPNNLLLNSATLSTQNVTTSPINYILSFSGTGTVTLTGASTAGPLVGTGVSNRVFLAFTPTAGTLTLTVSGSVTSAQLEAVTYQTSPSTYNATTASAYFGARFDYDPNTLAAKGLLIEEQRTNQLLQSNAFSNAAWTIMAQTLAQNVTGPNGVANSAWTLTAAVGASGHQLYQGVASQTVVGNSLIAKAGTASWLGLGFDTSATADGAFFNLSTGVVGTVAAGATASIQNLGNGWYRCFVTRTYASGTHYQTIEPHTADAQAPTWTAAGTETIVIFNGQMEAATFPTSPIFTAAASVTRSADLATLTIPGSLSASGYSIGVAGYVPPLQSSREILHGKTAGATDAFDLFVSTSPSWREYVYDTSGGNVHADLNPALADGAKYQWVGAWATGGIATSINGSAVATATPATTIRVPITIELGSNAGSQFINTWISKIAIWNSALSNANVVAKSPVGTAW